MKFKLTEMATNLRHLMDAKKQHEEDIKGINKSIKELAEKLIPEYMEENEIAKVTVDGVGTLSVQQKLYTNVLAADREKLYAWLRDTGNEDMVNDWVFPVSLKAFCKEQLENGKPLPEVVTAHFVPTATLRSK